MKKLPLHLAAILLTLSMPIGQAQAAAYKVDPSHTFVTWEASHAGTSTSRGRFDKTGGTIFFDRAGKSGTADITIQSGSMNTGLAAFDKHLKSADFFNATQFPEVTFKGLRFVFDGDKVSVVEGTLTLLGKTQPVTLKATRFKCYDNDMLKREVCGGDFETIIQRSRWGMDYAVPGIPDQVRLLIQVEAVRE